jgi:hypothetical protein
LRLVRIERLHLSKLSGPALVDAAARLLVLGFAIAAVLLSGRWLTTLTAPRPVAELPATPMLQQQLASASVTRLFAAASVASPVVEGLQLTGVFSGSRGGGFATLRTGAGEVHAFRGDEVAPGVVVKDIAGDRVILIAAGVERELKLAADAGGQTAAPSPSPGGGRAAVAMPRLPQRDARAGAPQVTRGIPANPPQPIEPERE